MEAKMIDLIGLNIWNYGWSNLRKIYSQKNLATVAEVLLLIKQTGKKTFVKNISRCNLSLISL